MTSSVSAPTVDMIVAVHDLRRSIRRAVGSVLSDRDPSIRVLVVAHNLPAADVAAALGDLVAAHPGRVRIEELNDGIPSPSGPFNFGMAVSDADYVGIMGSDDELDPDAIAQWRRRAERFRADAVVAKVVRGEQRTLVRSPPKRVWRTGVLDFVRDRLSYRSAPLGLMRREAVARLGLELLAGARNGGDLPFVTRLWLRGRVVADHGTAAYIVHDDAPERVTLVAKPVAEELAPVRQLLDSELVHGMTVAQREALTTKILRRNVMDSLRKRDGGRRLTADDVDTLRELLRTIRRLAPRATALVSPLHRGIFDELEGADPDLGRVAQLDEEIARMRSLAALLPADARHLLHSQGQPRFVVASALIKIGASRYFSYARGAAIASVVAVAAVVASRLLPRR